MIEYFSRAELLKVERPSRYLGMEANSVRKEPSKVKVRFALCFPDIYEVAMSHYGSLLLYDILNSSDHFSCERAFLPWRDMATLIRSKSLYLSTLESGDEVRTFDVLGISVSTELAATNIVELLSLAGIKPLSHQRNEPFPLILGGGAAMFNPEPIAPFFDAILIGDGEEAVLEISHLVSEAKKHSFSKTKLLESLTQVEGVYIPSFFEPIYENNRFKQLKPLKKGYERVKRRYLKDINKSRIPNFPLMPLTETVHDRLTAEISRGCVVGCRFCQAGFTYRPFREKDPETLYKNIITSLDNSGYEEVSLLSLSSSDYSGLQTVARALFDRFYEEKISLSLPSLRVSDSYSEILNMMSRLRKSGITIAPEVATEKLRRFINKPINETELFNTVAEISSLGWRSLKLYFLVGLPTETDEDITSIASLLDKIVHIARTNGSVRQINLTVSPFVPKPHTPLQWEKFAGIPEIERKVNLLAQKLRRNRFVNLRRHDPRLAHLETILSRGDRKLSDAILQAHKNGALFDSWNEQFNYEAWDNAFNHCGIDTTPYLSEIPVEQTLPWEHIDILVTKEFLLKERELAYSGILTPVCRYETCNSCGVCPISPDGKYPSAFLCEEKEIRPIRHRPPHHSGITFRYRIHFTKTEEASFLGHLETKRLLERAFRRASIPLKFSEGNSPEPKISFGQPVPIEVESTAELFDVELTERVDPKEIPDRVNPY
ncbi:MAG: TIGR03960 family B12-binding radical SAM protein, partial [Planctomycetota bacterium]|nr:TIGR03960 family B12-binding radical SAM protein [Planctomycetota bacterium]